MRAGQVVEKRQQDLKKKQDAFEKKVGDLDFVLGGAQQVKLNVGGQVFEIAAKHLVVDRFSLLANVCRKEPVIEMGEDGSFFFDRDWWIFRHIYLFLLDGTLPTSVATLRELYYEATFYRLSLLRYAIETRILADKERKEKEAEAHARMGAMGGRRSMGSPQGRDASTAMEAGAAMRAGAAYGGGAPSYYDRAPELGMTPGHALGCAGSAMGGSGVLSARLVGAAARAWCVRACALTSARHRRHGMKGCGWASLALIDVHGCKPIVVVVVKEKALPVGQERVGVHSYQV